MSMTYHAQRLTTNVGKVHGPRKETSVDGSSSETQRLMRQTRCSHIGKASGRAVHHEARFTCLEKNWQPTLEVAQEEVATPKASTPTSKGLMLEVEYTGV